jgi:Cys-tRNA(Pro)/Cys-tRNA(Cys) deacylase
VASFAAEDFTAQEVADKLSLSLESIYKTLVARGEKTGVVLAVVPGDKDLNLKKLARALNDKKAEMVRVEDLQKLTGYLKGGVSPLGTKRTYPVYVEQAILTQNRVSVSAGLRGLQILITPPDLVRASSAQLADLC